MNSYKVVINMPINSVVETWHVVAQKMGDKNGFHLVPVVYSGFRLYKPITSPTTPCTIIEGIRNPIIANIDTWKRVVKEHIVALCDELQIVVPDVEFHTVELESAHC